MLQRSASTMHVCSEIKEPYRQDFLQISCSPKVKSLKLQLVERNRQAASHALFIWCLRYQSALLPNNSSTSHDAAAQLWSCCPDVGSGSAAVARTGNAGTALCRCQAAWMLSANRAMYSLVFGCLKHMNYKSIKVPWQEWYFRSEVTPIPNVSP